MGIVQEICNFINIDKNKLFHQKLINNHKIIICKIEILKFRTKFKIILKVLCLFLCSEYQFIHLNI